MERHRLYIEQVGTRYKISIIGIGVLLGTFLALGPYILMMGNELDPLIKISAISMFGLMLGFIAGLPKLDMKIDIKAVGIGLVAYACIAIIKIMQAPLSIASTAFYVTAAVLEELGFRLGLQRFLERILRNPHIAIIIQATAFMIYHWLVYPGYEAISVFPLISGLVLGYSLYISKDLTAPLIAHVLNNLI